MFRATYKPKIGCGRARSWNLKASKFYYNNNPVSESGIQVSFQEKFYKSYPPKNLILKRVIAIKLFMKINNQVTLNLPVPSFKVEHFPRF
jgi:hypothetical protein